MGAIRTAAAGFLILVFATATAADCVTESRLVSSRASTPNLVNGPIAWSGSVFAVAKTEDGVAGAIWIGLYDENFNPLAAHRRVATDGRAIVALVWTGSEFGLFYRTATQRLHLLRLTPGGEPIGAPVAITPNRTVSSADEIDAVWSGALNAYVVARAVGAGREAGLWITLIERDGTQRSDRSALVNVAQQSELDLTVSESGVIGVFFNNAAGNLAFARAEAAGPVGVRTMTAGGTRIQATAFDNRFVVMRAVLTEADETEIRWFVVDSSQQIVRPDDLFIDPPGDDVVPLALISTPDELALAYLRIDRREQALDQIYRLRRFTIDGTTISDTEFAPRNSSHARAFSDYRFVWTGQAYVSAPARVSSDRANSFLVRYCPLLAEIVLPEDTNVIMGELVTFSAVASGGVPEYQYAWIIPGEIGPKTVQTYQRAFPNRGRVTVTLVVTDATGASVRRTITLQVGKPKQRAVR